MYFICILFYFIVVPHKSLPGLLARIKSLCHFTYFNTQLLHNILALLSKIVCDTWSSLL